MMRSFLDDFMGQRWGDLLLLHWPISIDIIKPTIPIFRTGPFKGGGQCGRV